MDILFVSEFFHPRAAGGEVWSWELCTGLARRGHTVTVLTLRHDRSDRDEEIAGVRILRPHDAGKGRLTRKYAASQLSRTVARYLDHHRPDVVHVMAYLMNVPVSLLARERGIPCVTAVHSYFGDAWRHLSILWPLLRLLERRYLLDDASSVMHVPSAYLQRMIMLETGRRCEIAHNWLPERFPRPVRLARGTYLFVGSLERIKDPVACVRAARGKRLVVIGEGPLERAMRAAARRERVPCTFLRRLPHEEALAYLGGASLLLVPSIEESFSLVAIEAIAQGTPVSGTPVGVLPELPGVVAFPPRKTPARLSAAVQRRVREEFSREKGLDRIEELYKQAGSRRRPRLA